ncbi:hypothetical protein PENTCL1PPCAC_28440, partial [Pristionchus entomophagus]
LLSVTKMFTALILSCLLVSSIAAESTESIGVCIAGQCPDGYECLNEECVVISRTKRGTTCPKDEVIGECIGNLCPKGFRCDGDHCC